jgi:hypothetical protein
MRRHVAQAVTVLTLALLPAAPALAHVGHDHGSHHVQTALIILGAIAIAGALLVKARR